MFFFCLTSSIIVTHGMRPPYTAEKFKSVMDLSKLQEVTMEEGEEEQYVPELHDFASKNFHLLDSDNMLFRIRGSSKRSELRERTASDENAGWSISETHTMTGKVAIPKQEEGLEEVTFLQAHCASGALVRLSWVDDYKNENFRCEDCTIANVRQGLGDDDVPKYFLSQRHEGYEDYKITVSKSKLYVWVNGKLMVDAVDVSFWKNEPCYFKAGAYNNHPSNDNAEAVMKISSLTW